MWTKYDGLIYVNEVVDCGDRSVVGHCISKRCRAEEAVWALEGACLKRFGVLPGRPASPCAATTVWSSPHDSIAGCSNHTALSQEFIHPHTPEQNGVIEAYHKTFKRECVWQHRFATLEEATPIISSWIERYNTQRPHSRLDYLTQVPGGNATRQE